jgi:hypothetical protein
MGFDAGSGESGSVETVLPLAAVAKETAMLAANVWIRAVA